jgi:hypothetical protein
MESALTLAVDEHDEAKDRDDRKGTKTEMSLGYIVTLIGA